MALILLIVIGINLYLFISSVGSDNSYKDTIHQLEETIENQLQEIADRQIIIDSLHVHLQEREETIKKLQDELNDIEDQPIPDSYITMPADSAVREFLRRHYHN